MTIVGTGKWAIDTSKPNTSVQNRDFFSGNVAVANTSYDASHKFEFGFSASVVAIHNYGSVDLVIQWLNRDGSSFDNDVVKAGDRYLYNHANKEGISVRVESSSTNCRIVAWG